MAETVRLPREVRLGVERIVAETVRRLRTRRSETFVGQGTGFRLFTGDDFLRLELLIVPLVLF